ncbi:MAG: DUF4232 domain-containing protein [Acidimicrobiales bacterium]
MASLNVKMGKTSVSTSVVEIGFEVVNHGASGCRIEGDPTLRLLGASGALAASISFFGPSPPELPLLPSASGGFVMQYTAAGGITTCDEADSAHVVGIDVSLPMATGSAQDVKVGLHACPASSPTVKVSAVLSLADYHDLLHVTGGSTTTTTTS